MRKLQKRINPSRAGGEISEETKGMFRSWFLAVQTPLTTKRMMRGRREGEARERWEGGGREEEEGRGRKGGREGREKRERGEGVQDCNNKESQSGPS